MYSQIDREDTMVRKLQKNSGYKKNDRLPMIR